MADQENTPEEPEKKGKGLMIVGVLMALLAGAGGFLLPTMMPSLFNADAAQDEKAMAKKDPTEFAFLEFGEVVVNLNMDRFNRYLKLKVTLEVAKDRSAEIERMLEERRAVLRGWLISHLADKTMEEIRGGAGQNQLRREIHDQFNALLFVDGYDVVHDVYFEEFNVQ